jgi:putative oxidoreductase
VQRLFSTFPNAWPGFGLLVLRLAASISLIGIAYCETELRGSGGFVLRGAALAVAALLTLGFGTPLVAVSEAAIQVGVMVLERHYSSSALVAAAVGVGLAMLGPGAWSLDARMFGRKRLV